MLENMAIPELALFLEEFQQLEHAVAGEVARREGLLIVEEFGKPDILSTVKSADEGIDPLIACGFNYETHRTDLKKQGRIPVLNARMNSDLRMAWDLQSTTTGSLSVEFGVPDSALKTILKAETNKEPWISLKRDVSRAFEQPSTGRIAVKVINHLGDEVMKVFRV